MRRIRASGKQRNEHRRLQDGPGPFRRQWICMSSENGKLAAAVHIARMLRETGYEAYLAGGCVRDLLLGRAPADYDVATSATPDVVLRLFERTFSVGAHFGVVLVALGDEGNSVVTEVATFRSDGAYLDGRHPDSVRYTESAEEMCIRDSPRFDTPPRRPRASAQARPCAECARWREQSPPDALRRGNPGPVSYTHLDVYKRQV